MSIYRGAGGSGDAVNDSSSEALITLQARDAALAAQAAAEAAQTAAELAETNAETAETNAETAETNAETAETNAETAATNAAASASAASTSASNAASSASSASTSASNASSSASSASTSATNAANSASTASTQATNASNSASAASTSATNAASSATAAAASYDSFDDRYLGSKSSAPSVDNDGNALLTGALYFNTVDNAMKVYNGSAWLDAYASLSGALIATNNLADLTNTGTARTNLGVAIGTNVQAYDAQLADIAGLTPTDNNFIVGNGTNFVTESGSTARTSLGLGSIATQDASNVAVTGGSINGTTIGATTATTGAFTTATASTSVTTPIVQATNSGGLSLRNSAGTTQISMGGGGGDNVSINVATNINGANAQIDISPTGTGHVHIKPTGTGSLEIAPTNAGTMNNMVIGGTTPLAGTFTDLRFNGTLSAAGSTGTSGFVMTSNGASAPTWQAIPASSITITDDTTTNATRYLAFTSATSGTITGQNVASTKLQFNPSTGLLTSTGFAGSGADLTNLDAGDISAGTLAVARGGTGVTTSTGSGNNVLSTSPTLTTPILGTPTSGNLSNCTADGTNLVGYRNVPQSGSDKTSSYTLVTGDVGEFVGVGSGGSITIPNSTFATGDIISLFNNTTGNITITCSITTTYVAGVNTDRDTLTLATRGVATILFISGTVCVISGNVS